MKKIRKCFLIAVVTLNIVGCLSLFGGNVYKLQSNLPTDNIISEQ